MEAREEYNALRQELLQKDTQFNDYRKSAYAVTTAVLAFSLTQGEPFISLLPIIIIVPLYIISEDGLRAMSKIGAYIRVFYNDKGFYWERRNMSYCERIRGKERKKEVFANNAMIYLALIFICGVCSLYQTYAEYSLFAIQHQPPIIHASLYHLAQNKVCVRIVVILVVVFISVGIIFKKKVYMDDERKIYQSIWEDIRNTEATINNHFGR